MKEFGPFVLRLGLGGLFLTAGIFKLLDPAALTTNLASLGFPGAAAWAWLLLLTEMILGVALIAGFKMKFTTPPLMLILLVAASTNATGNWFNSLINVALITSLISLWLTGPGKWALSTD